MRAIAVADFRSFAAAAARGRALRLGALAAALAAAAVGYAAAPRSTTPPEPLLAKGASTIVVCDLSASISWDTYARIAATLDRLRRSGGRVGLIVFSDTAYQTLPPGTPAAELASFERFFVVRQPGQQGFQPQPPHSPWTDAFSSGTRISTGLQLALDVIRAGRVRHPRVVLISDLDDDAGDLESLTSVALAYRHLGVPISVAALNPSPQDAATMARLLPRGGGIVDIPLTTQPRQAPHAGPAWWLVACAGVLALALAAATLVSTRLRWSV
ncbi:MAG TPA: vWA domain-containing protein [Gaiellaceae bacterium]